VPVLQAAAGGEGGSDEEEGNDAGHEFSRYR
jgi:hypothetical protein